MRTLWALLALLAPFAQAHTSFTTLFVNGLSQGDGTCVRMNTVSGRVNSPVEDITSTDITCGQSGITPVARTCPIKVGDTVSFQFRSGPGTDSTESIVEGHKGPCAIYMKQMSKGEPQADGRFPSQSPAGDGWFKIMYDGVDAQDQWCTQRLNQTAEGVITTKIPTDLAPGYYLLRPELLALHAATKRDPQFYTGCAQVYISGGTSQAKPETASIPGYVKYEDQAMSWNLYNQTGAGYPEYGPKKYKVAGANDPVTSAAASATSSATASTASSAAASSTPAVKSTTAQSAPSATATPKTATCGIKRSRVARYADMGRREVSQDGFSCQANTILELGNLCLPEVPHWRDSDSSMRNCWASQKYCWELADTCWKGRSPAVSWQKGKGCDVYAQRCTTVGDACKNQVMEGPPDEGKVLTPDKVTLTGYGIVG